MTTEDFVVGLRVGPLTLNRKMGKDRWLCDLDGVPYYVNLAEDYLVQLLREYRP